MKFFTEFINNIRKHNIKKIDFFFVCVFFVLLFIPMLHVTGAKKSVQENRVLAKQPHFIVNHKLNQKYGMEFNDYFNDRFLGRHILINIDTELKFSINSVYQNEKALYIKKNGWMFNKTQPQKLIEYDDIVANLKKFDDFCKSHNMKLYVLLVPEKEFIYNDISSFYYQLDKKQLNAYNKKIEKLKDILPSHRVIYPYNELIDASKMDLVFFKQSHHWTDFGAYIGYNALLSGIQKDFSNVKKISLEKDNNLFVNNRIKDEYSRNFEIGYTTFLLNLAYKADLILNYNYNYYENKNSNKMIEDRGRYIKTFENKNKNARLKLFLTGNSQNENLLQFLPYSFKNLKYVRLNRSQHNAQEQFKFMKYYKQELLDFKPDIVVVSLSSSTFFTLLKDFYKD